MDQMHFRATRPPLRFLATAQDTLLALARLNLHSVLSIRCK